MRRSMSKSNYPSKVVWLSNPKWIVDDFGPSETFWNATAAQ